MEAVQDPGAALDVEAIAQENARLRQQLLSENERLRAALAASQQENAAAKGLTDDDVRRIEHPEEYVAAENAEFRALLADLQQQVASVTTATTTTAVDKPVVDTPVVDTPVGEIAAVDTKAEPVALATLTDDELSAELARRKEAATQ